jgi:hypothetical protein
VVLQRPLRPERSNLGLFRRELLPDNDWIGLLDGRGQHVQEEVLGRGRDFCARQDDADHVRQAGRRAVIHCAAPALGFPPANDQIARQSLHEALQLQRGQGGQHFARGQLGGADDHVLQERVVADYAVDALFGGGK